jgi:hypothetical protein
MDNLALIRFQDDLRLALPAHVPPEGGTDTNVTSDP